MTHVPKQPPEVFFLTLLKRRLWYRCFSVNFLKFLRTPTGDCFCIDYKNFIKKKALLKKILWHRGFPVNFAKFSKTPVLQNTSRWLLLEEAEGWFPHEFQKFLDFLPRECKKKYVSGRWFYSQISHLFLHGLCYYLFNNRVYVGNTLICFVYENQ